jgi:hypothetical protein
MGSEMRITGGAGPMETAAILAAVARVLQDEAILAAQPATAPQQSGWVLAWRPREAHAPLPSHTYDVATWADRPESDDQP